MSDEKVDGYWLRMGALMTNALDGVLRPDLTPCRKEIVSQYFGKLLDNAYKMGIRLGELTQQQAAERNQ